MGNMKRLYEAMQEAQGRMGLEPPELGNVEQTQRAIDALLDSIKQKNGIEPPADQESMF